MNEIHLNRPDFSSRESLCQMKKLFQKFRSSNFFDQFCNKTIHAKKNSYMWKFTTGTLKDLREKKDTEESHVNGNLLNRLRIFIFVFQFSDEQRYFLL